MHVGRVSGCCGDVAGRGALLSPGSKVPFHGRAKLCEVGGHLKERGVLRGAKAEEMRARKKTGQRPLRSSVPAFEQEICSELPINQDIATTTTTTTVTTIFFDYMTKKKCI